MTLKIDSSRKRILEGNRGMNRLRADILLLVTAFIWGAGFIAMKTANHDMGPVSFIGARFLLSTLVLAPLAFFEAKKCTLALTRRDFIFAGLIGLCLFLGSALQQIGLVTSSVTNCGFLTALYVIFVPFAVWFLARTRPRLIVVAACVISLTGAWLLSDYGQAEKWSLGDVLIIFADIAWAIGIALVPMFLKRAPRPFFLSFVQFGICAILGLSGGFFFEPQSPQGLASAIPAILYTGLLSGGVGFTLQIIAQQHTPAAEAALIMSLESIFAATAGAMVFHEHLTLLATLGCALILLGVIVVEVGPVWLQSSQHFRAQSGVP